MIKTEKIAGRQRNRPIKDFAGQRFGRLVALSLEKRDGIENNHLWRMQCDCGQIVVRGIRNVRGGHTSSCGCAAREVLVARNQSHGLSHLPEYKRWKDMRARCSNKSNKEYPNYGGRGIEVCERWASFDAFFADMGKAPSGHTIDRIDVNGNYEPSNCRWAAPSVQMNNKRNNVRLEIDGETRTLAQWCRHYGMGHRTVSYRLKLGLSPKEAFTASDLRK